MSLKQELLLYIKAVSAFDEGDYESALASFEVRLTVGRSNV